MDVKACDVCKKTNLEGDLFSFFEYRLQRPQRVEEMPTKQAPVVGFSLRRATPRDAIDIEMGVMRDTELVCKACGEKKIIAGLALL